MKQIIIILLIVIAVLIGYGKYKQYKRYNLTEISYKTDKKIDLNYHNKEMVFNYYESIENLNSYIMMQWASNNIDVRAPKEDNLETKNAVENYAKKMAKVQYYEAILSSSLKLKEQGLSNKGIKFIEDNGIDFITYSKNKKFDKIKLRSVDNFISLKSIKSSKYGYFSRTKPSRV